MNWNKVSYITASKYRIEVMKQIGDAPKTPKQMEDNSDKPISHLSRAIQELVEEDLVKLLVDENKRKGRIYGFTALGKEVWGEIEEREMAAAE